MTRTKIFILALAMSVGATGVAMADGHNGTINACDRLAAHPLDPDKVTAGVSTSDVDKPAAIAACREAVESEPETTRFHYQLARVLFYDGQAEEATAIMEDAAEAGYRQAQFVMGAFIANNRPHVSTDICEAEKWWAKAAEAGREAAKVAYVRHTTKGLFDSCTKHASIEDMDMFLNDVRSGARDYYLRLLLSDLTEDLEAYKTER